MMRFSRKREIERMIQLLKDELREIDPYFDRERWEIVSKSETKHIQRGEVLSSRRDEDAPIFRMLAELEAQLPPERNPYIPPKKVEERPRCPVCGNTFEPRPGKIYCSKRCGRIARDRKYYYTNKKFKARTPSV